LWKRYLITIPIAVWFVGLELLQTSVWRSLTMQRGKTQAANPTGESPLP